MSAPHVQQNQPRGSRPVQRDPDLWFFDGNVVLVAQGILAFRVHKGVLAHHSEVFKSWFTGVAPPPSHGTIELCEGAQVQALLVIYGLRRLPVREASRVTFSVVAGLCRFALAYGLTALAKASFDLMDPTFSTDLEERDTLPDGCRLSFDLGDKQAIEAYNVSNLSDNGCIFMAIYLCAQLPLEVLRAGTRRADGTPEVLSEPDLQIILKAKAQLKQLSAKVLAECYNTRCSGVYECWNEFGCDDVFYHMRFPKGPGVQELVDGDAVSMWALDCIDELRDDERICEECARNTRKRHEGLRQAVWEEYMENVEIPEQWR
ncbi:hypothetical protein C8Q70DRAFT_935130 [Cubamyces menziesii]|nr:hypothetical protein C8Q70DRAFT_935130 [Cubamyces menziesii]